MREPCGLMVLRELRMILIRSFGLSLLRVCDLRACVLVGLLCLVMLDLE